MASRRSSAVPDVADKADDAQLNIGNSLYQRRQVRGGGDGVSEGDHRITRRPTACRWRTTSWGSTYEALKQLDLARKAFETVMQNYPTAYEAMLAQQALDAVEATKRVRGLEL